MHTGVIDLLAGYNKSINQKMDDIIKTLDLDEWDRNLGGFFPSVHSLCSHLYICDFNWLKRFKGLRSFAALSDSFYFGKTYSFTEILFADMGEYLAKRPVLDSRIADFSKELTSEDMGKTLKYSDSHGKECERIFGNCLLHFLNHQTHHRGMISVYLEMLGKENDFASLVDYIK